MQVCTHIHMHIQTAQSKGQREILKDSYWIETHGLQTKDRILLPYFSSSWLTTNNNKPKKLSSLDSAKNVFFKKNKCKAFSNRKQEFIANRTILQEMLKSPWRSHNSHILTICSETEQRE